MNAAQQMAVGRLLMSRAAKAPKSETEKLLARSRFHFLMAQRPELGAVLHLGLLDHPRGAELINALS